MGIERHWMTIAYDMDGEGHVMDYGGGDPEWWEWWGDGVGFPMRPEGWGLDIGEPPVDPQSEDPDTYRMRWGVFRAEFDIRHPDPGHYDDPFAERESDPGAAVLLALSYVLFVPPSYSYSIALKIGEVPLGTEDGGMRTISERALV